MVGVVPPARPWMDLRTVSQSPLQSTVTSTFVIVDTTPSAAVGFTCTTRYQRCQSESAPDIAQLACIYVSFNGSGWCSARYLERRFSRPCRTVLAITSLVAYVLSKLSVSVFSGAQIAEVVFGIPKMVCRGTDAPSLALCRNLTFSPESILPQLRQVAAVGLILVTATYTVFGNGMLRAATSCA